MPQVPTLKSCYWMRLMKHVSSVAIQSLGTPPIGWVLPCPKSKKDPFPLSFWRIVKLSWGLSGRLFHVAPGRGGGRDSILIFIVFMNCCELPRSWCEIGCKINPENKYIPGRPTTANHIFLHHNSIPICLLVFSHFPSTIIWHLTKLAEMTASY